MGLKEKRRPIQTLPIAQAIDKNKLRWFGHVTRREEESTLRVVVKLNVKENKPRGRPRLASQHR